MKTEKRTYIFPPLSLLKNRKKEETGHESYYLLECARKIENVLEYSGVRVTVVNVCAGPISVRYDLTLDAGVRLAEVKYCADDIAFALGCEKVTIAPVEGKCGIVGIDVPTKDARMVYLREVLDSQEFRAKQSSLAFALGKDTIGNDVICDLNKERHLLIGGTTGSGKSTMIHSMIISLLYHSAPDKVRFLMVDTKGLELTPYQAIPHLMIPVITEEKRAIAAINWLNAEMQHRYRMFSEIGARNFEEYSSKKPLSSIVAVVDDIFQILSYRYDSVEEVLCNLILKGHLVGIHLILSTQYVYSGEIVKLINLCNMGRISFALPGRYDSIAFLGEEGAEQLSGKGELLYLPIGGRTTQHIQGCFVFDDEIEAVSNYVKASGDQESVQYNDPPVFCPKPSQKPEDGYDEYLKDAMKFVLDKERVSIGMLQRTFKIGFNRAARLMDQMEEIGFVGAEDGTKPRLVLGDSIEPYLAKMKKSEACLECEEEQATDSSSIAIGDQTIHQEEIIEELPPIVISSETVEQFSKNKLKKRGIGILKRFK